jgi:crotonobetainyl-CoA:carnitine CoA-transferase CaiB-like acyl-CoA transferase
MAPSGPGPNAARPGRGPLDRLVVADFSRVLAGPLATQILGDLGADVIKVERPGSGDDTRAWGPPWLGEESTYYLGLNRNKRSIALDLAHEHDRETARRIVEAADVVVENFRPGAMERLRLAYDDVAAANPGLIYCSITGFGSAAEASTLGGYDFLVQAMGGLMSITGEADGEPTKVAVALIDKIAGLYAVIGILAALADRDRTGEGRHVEVSLLGAALAGLLNAGSGWLNAGVQPSRMGNRHPSIAPYQTYRAADGPLAIATGNQGHWRRLCEVLGTPELADDPRFVTNAERVANVEDLETVLEQALAGRPAAAWIEALRSAGVPAGPINDIGGAFGLAEALGLDAVWELDGVKSAANPIRIATMPASVQRRPPRLDEHREEILAWLERRGSNPARFHR